MGDMHPEDIKAAVRKTGKSLAALATEVGITRQMMVRTLTYPAARNERLIAKTIGLPASHIWPSRYHSDGRRKRPQPPENYRNSYQFNKGVVS